MYKSQNMYDNNVVISPPYFLMRRRKHNKYTQLSQYNWQHD